MITSITTESGLMQSRRDDGNFLFSPSPVKLLRDIGRQKLANFYEARLAQAGETEPEGETVDGHISFSLGASIDDSSDNFSDSNDPALEVWSGDEEIIDV